MVGGGYKWGISFLLLLILCVRGLPIFSQASLTANQNPVEQTQSENTDTKRAVLAMTSGEYRVTEGDIYSISFSANGRSVTYKSIVTNDLKLKVANLAVLDVAGKTFPVVRVAVEKIIINNYSFSAPQFVLLSPSIFKVRIAGEVNENRERDAWSMTRLSEIIASDDRTPYSSNRFFTIKNKNGKEKKFDLFLARRLGQKDQDPFLKPGDTVIVEKRGRAVEIFGEVKRKGSYELTDGENLKSLLEYYGAGFTDWADETRFLVRRYEKENADLYSAIYLSGDDLKNDFELFDHDSVTIFSIGELRPYFFLEGAVSENADFFTRRAMRFRAGETYGSFFRENKNIFSRYADLKNAKILRPTKTQNTIIQNENIVFYDEILMDCSDAFFSNYEDASEIPIDIFSYLLDAKKPCTEFIKKDDLLVVPFKQTYPLLPYIWGENYMDEEEEFSDDDRWRGGGKSSDKVDIKNRTEN